MHAAIVCTTILEADFLPALCRNLHHHGRERQTTIWIIPDRRTPRIAAARTAERRSQGFDVRYVTLEQQAAFLEAVPEMAALIPYNSDNRRNIGFLMALAQGADVLISIDDDNYPLIQHDFVGEHLIVGRTTDELITSSNGWYNICDRLETSPSYPIHPRGFPYRLRHERPPTITRRRETLPIGINAGLWSGDPDVDAITRNYHPFEVIAWKEEAIALAPGTWTPINTQNTALLAELIPAYYYVRMNENIDGLRIDRFGDILSGLFCKKVCDHLGYAVRVGTPVCEHRRTPHNLLKDLQQELAGIALLEELTAWLETVELFGTDVDETYLCLADALDEALPRFRGHLWGPAARAFFTGTTHSMRTWVEATRIVQHDRQLVSLV